MEPLMSQGDLAILRVSRVYEVGAVVTYQDPNLGPVIHRIISAQNGTFTLQGDNNDWIDPYQPTPNEVIGKLWLHIPHAGTVLSFIRRPIILTVFSLILGLFIMGTPLPKNSTQQASDSNTYVEQSVSAESEQSITDILLLLAVVLLGASILASVSFTKPLTTVEMIDTPYQHAGHFSYSAPVPDGLYDSQFAVTGQPVFFDLTQNMTFEFAYEFDAGVPYDVQTTYDISVVVTERNGWSRSVPLRSETNNAGDRFISVFTVELSQLQGIIQTYERETGLQLRQYSIFITPEVYITGNVGSQPINDAFAPVLIFNTDKQQVWLEERITDEGSSQLTPKIEQFVALPQVKTNTLALFGFDLPVRTVRLVSLLFIGLCLLGFGIVLLTENGLPTSLQDASKREEQSTIRSQYVPTQSHISIASPVRLASIPDPQLPRLLVWIMPAGFSAAALLFIVIFLIATITRPGDVQQASVQTGTLEFAQVEPAETVRVPTATIPAGMYQTYAGSSVDLAAYVIDIYEVTNEQWQACVVAGACLPNQTVTTTSLGPTYLTQAFSQFPVVHITQPEAAQFCQWRGARLPSALEWDIAAYWQPATQTSTIFPWGSQSAAQHMNTCDDDCLPDDPAQQRLGIADGWAQLAPVGSYPEGKSGLGLFDMAGNAAEWVAAARDDQAAVRGGAWNLQPDYAQAPSELSLPPDTRNPGIGFRCAQTTAGE